MSRTIATPEWIMDRVRPIYHLYHGQGDGDFSELGRLWCMSLAGLNKERLDRAIALSLRISSEMPKPYDVFQLYMSYNGGAHGLIGYLVSEAAALTGLKRDQILGFNRCQKFARVRHAIALSAISHSTLSYPAIAREMGRTDHTTIVNSMKRAQAMIAKKDKAFIGLCDALDEAARSFGEETRRAS